MLDRNGLKKVIILFGVIIFAVVGLIFATNFNNGTNNSIATEKKTTNITPTSEKVSNGVNDGQNISINENIEDEEDEIDNTVEEIETVNNDVNNDVEEFSGENNDLGSSRYVSGFIPSEVDERLLSHKKKFNFFFAPANDNDSLPSSYDLRNVDGVNYDNSVKDQGAFGTCWAFATMGSAESSYKKKIGGDDEVDFSEVQLAYYINNSYGIADELGLITNDGAKTEQDGKRLYNGAVLTGGNGSTATYALASGNGLIDEKHLPYKLYFAMGDEGSSIEYSDNDADLIYAAPVNVPAFSERYAVRDFYENDKFAYSGQYFLKDASWLNIEERDVIKKKIMEVGAVEVALLFDEYFFNDDLEPKALIYNVTGADATVKANHAVLVIGWDDNYSRNNFLTDYKGHKPSSDGAWLIKNSHGEFNQYFYVSYEEKSLDPIAYSFNVDKMPSNNAYHFYQYDGGSYDNKVTHSTGDKEVFTKTVFKAQNNEEVKYVGVGLLNANVTVKITITGTSLNGTPLNVTKETVVPDAGYHLIPMDETVKIKKDTNFTIIVQYNSDSNIELPVCPKGSFLANSNDNNVGMVSYNSDSPDQISQYSSDGNNYATNDYTYRVKAVCEEVEEEEYVTITYDFSGYPNAVNDFSNPEVVKKGTTITLKDAYVPACPFVEWEDGNGNKYDSDDEITVNENMTFTPSFDSNKRKVLIVNLAQAINKNVNNFNTLAGNTVVSRDTQILDTNGDCIVSGGIEINEIEGFTPSSSEGFDYYVGANQDSVVIVSYTRNKYDLKIIVGEDSSTPLKGSDYTRSGDAYILPVYYGAEPLRDVIIGSDYRNSSDYIGDVPTRKIYEFRGYEEEVPNTMPAHPVTLTAKWEGKSHRFRFEYHIDEYGDDWEFSDESFRDTSPLKLPDLTNPPKTLKEQESYLWSDVRHGEILDANFIMNNFIFKFNSLTTTNGTDGSAYEIDTEKTTLPYVVDMSEYDPRWTDTLNYNYFPVDIYLKLKDVTMTFNTNGGTPASIDSISGKAAKTYTKPANPTKANAEFLGWEPELPDYLPANSTTYVAKWKHDNERYYNIEHYKEELDGTYTKVDLPASPLLGVLGSTVSANSYIKSFEGFSFDTNNQNNLISATVPDNNSLVLKLYYKRNTHKVTFKDDDDIVKEYNNVKYGTLLGDLGEAPTPTVTTKGEFQFAGWDCDFESDTMPDEDIVINSVWALPIPLEHYVEKWDGTFELRETETVFGVPGEYTYAGWENYKETYTDAVFDWGWHPDSMLEGTVTSDLVLKVYYNLRKTTVKFMDGDTVLKEYKNVKYGTPLNTLQDIPVPSEKPGYTFIGWDPDLTSPVTSGLVVSAKWEKSGAAYKVEHYKEKLDGNYELVETENLSGDPQATVTATAKTYEGFTNDTSVSGTKTSGTVLEDGSLTLKLYYKRNTHKVTFKDGDTVLKEFASVKYGTTINSLAGIPTPTKDGYTFSSWDKDLSATTPDSDLVIKASWTANTNTAYKVEHYKEKLDGAYEVADTENKTGTTATTATATAKTYEGFTYDNTISGTVASGTIAGDGSLTLKLYYKRNTHKVTFKDGDTTLKEFTNVKFGTTLNSLQGIPTPTKQGYTFAGWDKELTTNTPNADLVVTANWTPATNTAYKVEHYKEKLDGAYEVADTENKTGTTATTATATAKTYEGFTYDGSAQGTVASGAIAADGSLTLKLYYKRNTITVTFKVANGKWSDSTTADKTVSCKYEGSLATADIPTGMIANTGYGNGAWDTTPNTTAQIKTATTYTYSFSKLTYVVTFNNKGKGSVTPTTVNALYGDKINEPSVTEPQGFALAGWYKDDNTFQNKWNFASDTVTGTTTLYAKWEAGADTPYKVEHYKENLSGTYDLAETEDKNGFTDATATAVAKTYEGFTHDSTISGTVASGTIAGDGSLTLKLYYKRNSYTITFDTDGGSAIDPITGKYESPVTAPSNPTKTGYTFTAWDKVIPTTMPASDTAIKASYTANTYKITYELAGGTFGTDHPETATYDQEITISKPTMQGYVFNGWNITGLGTCIHYVGSETKTGTTVSGTKATTFKNLNETKDAVVTFTATWSDHMTFEYNVQHFLENLDGTYPSEPFETSPYYDEANLTVNAEVKSYTGFTNDPSNTNAVPSGVVNEEGTLVLKLYYKRNTHNVTFKDGDSILHVYSDVKFGTVLNTLGMADPTKQGYTFTGWDTDLTTTTLDQDMTINAVWDYATDTAYKVEHYKQKLDGTYPTTADDTDNLTGTTASPVEASAKTYEGFACDLTVSDTVATGNIAGDGSLTLKLYYKRNTHKLILKDGDSVIKEISGVKYGATLNTLDIETPTKQGYTFDHWDVDLSTTTMPDEDKTIVASWTYATDTPYKVLHYKEKLDGTYELGETEELTGTTASTVTATAKTYTGFTYDNTINGNITSGTVLADGSLTLKLYYKRVIYSLTYKYNGSQSSQGTFKFEGTFTLPKFSSLFTANSNGRFKYWQIDNGDNHYYYLQGDSVKIDSNLVSSSTEIIITGVCEALPSIQPRVPSTPKEGSYIEDSTNNALSIGIDNANLSGLFSSDLYDPTYGLPICLESKSVPATDEEASIISQKYDNVKGFMEINLFNLNTGKYISETAKPLSISMTLTDAELINLAKAGKLAVYTIHEGEGQLITGTFNTADSKYTFNVTEFSVFAFVEATPAPNPSSGDDDHHSHHSNNGYSIPNTGIH